MRQKGFVISMYKLIIADDELIIRQHLMLSIDWNSLGFEVVADVEDGKTLYDKTIELMPDAVLIDIKMPVMSGIEYAKKIREINKSIKIVALSGYSESEYLMEMINIGIFSYMLKPFKESDMTDTFLRLAEELDKEASLHKMEQINVIGNYLRDNNYDVFVRDFKSNYKYFELIKVYFDEIPSHLINDTIKNINDCMDILFDCCYTIEQTNGYVLFCTALNNADASVATAQSAFICLNDTISTVGDNVSVSVCYLPAFDDWKNIRTLYEKFSVYEKSRFIYGRKKLIDVSVLENAAFSDEIIFFDNIKDIIKKLETNDIASLTNILKNFNDRLAAEHKSMFGIKQSYFYMINSIYRFLSENNMTNDKIKEICSDVFKHMENIAFSDSLYEYACNMLTEISKALSDNNMNQYINLYYEQAIDFIDKNFMYDISMSQLANTLGISYGYLSSIFKQKNNIGFVKQLRDRRMAEAKNLLCSTNMKIHEISKAVGFSNERYFSSVFHKEVGINPMKYRLKYSKE